MFKKNIKTLSLLSFTTVAIVLSGCGGGGGSTSDEPTTKTAQLVDEPIAGVYYESGNLSGSTSIDGSFKYQEGKDVTFRIGNSDSKLKFTIDASKLKDTKGVLTPLDIFNEEDSKRFAQIVQSLDTNSSDNKIDLSNLSDIDLPAINFSDDSNVTTVFNTIKTKLQTNSVNVTLKDKNDAYNKFIANMPAFSGKLSPTLEAKIAGKSTLNTTFTISGVTGETSNNNSIAKIIVDADGNGFDDYDYIYTQVVKDGAFNFSNVKVSALSSNETLPVKLTITGDSIASYEEILDINNNDTISKSLDLTKGLAVSQTVKVSNDTNTSFGTSSFKSDRYVTFGIKKDENGQTKAFTIKSSSLNKIRAMANSGTDNDAQLSVTIDTANIKDKDKITSMTATMKAFDSTNDDDLEFFPGKFEGFGFNDGITPSASKKSTEDYGQSEGTLESFAFARIEIKDQDGNPINPTSSIKTAATSDKCFRTIFTRLNQTQYDKVMLKEDMDDNKTGHQVPMWSYISRFGNWVYVGQGTLSTNKILEVCVQNDDLTYINLDYFNRYIATEQQDGPKNICVVSKDQFGNSLSGVRISANGTGSSNARANAYTNYDGNATLKLVYPNDASAYSYKYSYNPYGVNNIELNSTSITTNTTNEKCDYDLNIQINNPFNSKIQVQSFDKDGKIKANSYVRLYNNDWRNGNYYSKGKRTDTNGIAVFDVKPNVTYNITSTGATATAKVDNNTSADETSDNGVISDVQLRELNQAPTVSAYITPYTFKEGQKHTVIISARDINKDALDIDSIKLDGVVLTSNDYTILRETKRDGSLYTTLELTNLQNIQKDTIHTISVTVKDDSGMVSNERTSNFKYVTNRAPIIYNNLRIFDTNNKSINKDALKTNTDYILSIYAYEPDGDDYSLSFDTNDSSKVSINENIINIATDGKYQLIVKAIDDSGKESNKIFDLDIGNKAPEISYVYARKSIVKVDGDAEIFALVRDIDSELTNKELNVTISDGNNTFAMTPKYDYIKNNYDYYNKVYTYYTYEGNDFTSSIGNKDLTITISDGEKTVSKPLNITIDTAISFYRTLPASIDLDKKSSTNIYALARSLSGYVSYSWKIDGEIQSTTGGYRLYINGASLSEGDHNITCTASTGENSIPTSTILKITDQNATILITAADELDFNDIKMNNSNENNVTSNLYLPYYLNGSTYNYVRVNWDSNNSDIIDSFGYVNRPSVDTTVKLTANLSYNGETKAKDINVTVKAKPNLDQQYVEDTNSSLSFDLIKNQNRSEDEITEKLFLPRSIYANNSGYNGVTISWDSNNSNILDEYGNITRNTTTNIPVKLTATITKGSANISRIFNLVILKDNTAIKTAIEDAIKKELFDLNNQNRYSLENNITLVKSLMQGDNNITISWSSDHNETLSSTGEVTRGSKDQFVILTATASNSQVVDTASKSFGFLVKRAITDIEVVNLASKILTYPVILQDNLNASEVNSKLNLVTTIYKDGVSISWNSSNQNVVSNTGDINASTTAQVVSLDANISYKDESITKRFTVTVLPSDKAIVDQVKNSISIPTIVSGDIDLPSVDTQTGAFISWSSDKPEVISDYGKVTRQAEDTNVTLTATIIKGLENIKEEFIVTVQKSILSELTTQVNNITFDLIKGSNSSEDNITSNLDLITGINGYAITWSSSNEFVLNTDGNISKELEDIDVQLTATITKDGQSASKVFNLIVIKSPLSDIRDAAISLKEYILNDNNSSDYITSDLRFPTSYEGCTVSWDINDTTIVEPGGQVIRPDKTTPVTITYSLSKDGSSLDNLHYNVVVIRSDLSVVTEVSNNFDFNTTLGTANSSFDDIKYNLYLNTQSYNGVEFNWSSSNEDVIDNNGTVTRGDKDQNVTMTLVLSLNDANITRTQNYTVVQSDESKLNGALSSIELNIDENNVTTNFALPTVSDDVNFIWTSSNVSALEVVKGQAIVHRSTTDDQTVTLTVTAYLDTPSATVRSAYTRDFTIKISKYSQEELDNTFNPYNDINISNLSENRFELYLDINSSIYDDAISSPVAFNPMYSLEFKVDTDNGFIVKELRDSNISFTTNESNSSMGIVKYSQLKVSTRDEDKTESEDINYTIDSNNVITLVNNGIDAANIKFVKLLNNQELQTLISNFDINVTFDSNDIAQVMFYKQLVTEYKIEDEIKIDGNTTFKTLEDFINNGDANIGTKDYHLIFTNYSSADANGTLEAVYNDNNRTDAGTFNIVDGKLLLNTTLEDAPDYMHNTYFEVSNGTVHRGYIARAGSIESNVWFNKSAHDKIKAYFTTMIDTKPLQVSIANKVSNISSNKFETITLVKDFDFKITLNNFREYIGNINNGTINLQIDDNISLSIQNLGIYPNEDSININNYTATLNGENIENILSFNNNDLVVDLTSLENISNTEGTHNISFSATNITVDDITISGTLEVTNLLDGAVLDESKLQSALLGMNISADNIYTNLTLPIYVGSEEITWSSSNTTALSNDGIVTRTTSPQTVSLTASWGDGQSKVINLTLAPLSAIEQEIATLKSSSEVADVANAKNMVNELRELTYQFSDENLTAIGESIQNSFETTIQPEVNATITSLENSAQTIGSMFEEFSNDLNTTLNPAVEEFASRLTSISEVINSNISNIEGFNPFEITTNDDYNDTIKYEVDGDNLKLSILNSNTAHSANVVFTTTKLIFEDNESGIFSANDNSIIKFDENGDSKLLIKSLNLNATTKVATLNLEATIDGLNNAGTNLSIVADSTYDEVNDKMSQMDLNITANIIASNGTLFDGLIYVNSTNPTVLSGKLSSSDGNTVVSGVFKTSLTSLVIDELSNSNEDSFRYQDKIVLVDKRDGNFTVINNVNFIENPLNNGYTYNYTGRTLDNEDINCTLIQYYDERQNANTCIGNEYKLIVLGNNNHENYHDQESSYVMTFNDKDENRFESDYIRMRYNYDYETNIETSYLEINAHSNQIDDWKKFRLNNDNTIDELVKNHILGTQTSTDVNLALDIVQNWDDNHTKGIDPYILTDDNNDTHIVSYAIKTNWDNDNGYSITGSTIDGITNFSCNYDYYDSNNRYCTNGMKFDNKDYHRANILSVNDNNYTILEVNQDNAHNDQLETWDNNQNISRLFFKIADENNNTSYVIANESGGFDLYDNIIFQNTLIEGTNVSLVNNYSIREVASLENIGDNTYSFQGTILNDDDNVSLTLLASNNVSNKTWTYGLKDVAIVSGTNGITINEAIVTSAYEDENSNNDDKKISMAKLKGLKLNIANDNGSLVTNTDITFNKTDNNESFTYNGSYTITSGSSVHNFDGNFSVTKIDLDEDNSNIFGNIDATIEANGYAPFNLKSEFMANDINEAGFVNMILTRNSGNSNEYKLALMINAHNDFMKLMGVDSNNVILDAQTKVNGDLDYFKVLNKDNTTLGEIDDSNGLINYNDNSSETLF